MWVERVTQPIAEKVHRKEKERHRDRRKKSCHGVEVIVFTASLTRDPHEAYGAEIPNPRKERNDSCMINAGTRKVAKTMIIPAVLGIK